MELFLTVDVGTSGVKLAVFDEFFNSLFITVEEYNLSYLQVDFVEINPEKYYKVIKNGLLKFSKNNKHSTRDIKYISICSQAETFILLDNKNTILMDAIVWLDNRAVKESEIISREFGREKTYYVTGQQDIVPTWTACKLLWIKRNKPEIYKKVHKILFVQDYLIYKLTSKFFTDFSMLPSSLLFDIVKLKWWQEMISFLNISEEQLPVPVNSGHIVGNISKSAAEELELNSNAIVITGAQDHMAGLIGSGNIRQGIMSETTGTALAICTTIDKPVYDKNMNIPVYIHSLKGKYLLLPWSHNSGIILRWFRDNFFGSVGKDVNQIESTPFSFLDKMASEVDPGSDGLVLLPFFSGAGSPELNSRAKGVFYGVSLSHERKHFVRAIMESIAYILKSNINALEDLGVEIDEIRSLGGGSKSDLWCQIKADVLNKKVIKLENEEVSSIGLAILSSFACGKITNLQKAVDNYVKIKKVFYPDRKNHNLYYEIYNKYKKIYQSLKNVF